MEAIRAQRRKLRVLRVREGRQRPEVAAVVAAARQAGIPVESIGDAQFAEFAPAGGNPQRVVLEAEPLPELSLESLLHSIEAENPTLVALDGVEDPQNLGAIARVAEAAGVA
ncbi:MAG: RNA methyltransferase substrate-binding domain-containing protein, partial [Myxococcota bacterium]